MPGRNAGRNGISRPCRVRHALRFPGGHVCSADGVLVRDHSSGRGRVEPGLPMAGFRVVWRAAVLGRREPEADFEQTTRRAESGRGNRRMNRIGIRRGEDQDRDQDKEQDGCAGRRLPWAHRPLLKPRCWDRQNDGDRDGRLAPTDGPPCANGATFNSRGQAADRPPGTLSSATCASAGPRRRPRIRNEKQGERGPRRPRTALHAWSLLECWNAGILE
jgi:hypothetical protein